MGYYDNRLNIDRLLRPLIMYNLNVEEHFIKSLNLLPTHLAQDIERVIGFGKVAVIADAPSELLTKTKEAWQSLKNERTVSPIRFSAVAPTDLLNADVTFATVDAFSRIPPMCQHIFVTCPVTKQKLHMITSWMPKGSTVIIYR